ncbi:MAG: hypothetical protein U0T75_09055 [Chitinophagales bacterium]
MKRLIVGVLMLLSLGAIAQNSKPVYHPCFLMDSVDKHLDFIRINASRIFTDTVDCKQALMDSIGNHYLYTKDKKYLDLLTAIRQNQLAKVENNYTDLIKRFVEDDFDGFVDQLYLARGRYYVLEKEMIATLNMIVDGRPYKNKYLALLGISINLAKTKKDTAKQQFLEKLKTKIEEEKY